MQLAVAFSAIANNGKIFRPYVIKEVLNADGTIAKESKPEILNEIKLKNPKTLKFLKEGLYQVVNNPKGTAFYRRGEGIQMAGKSGTSQVKSASADKIYQKCESMPYEDRHHGVFVGFAPYDNPKIAAAVIIEHGCGGSSAAAPVAVSVIQEYMKKYEPEEYAKNLEKDKLVRQGWIDSLKKAKEAEVVKPVTEESED
jgi:penicillin-binding protein 2